MSKDKNTITCTHGRGLACEICYDQTYGLGTKKKLFASLAQPLPVYYPALSSAMRRQVREAYVHKQKGLCAHCNTKLTEEPDILIQRAWIDERLFPEGFFNHPIHLHHDHNTGMTIGALHARCNAYLWQYRGE